MVLALENKRQDAALDAGQGPRDLLRGDRDRLRASSTSCTCYKNLQTDSNIRDAAIEGSKRASDLHMKLEYLRASAASG